MDIGRGENQGRTDMTAGNRRAGGGPAGSPQPRTGFLSRHGTGRSPETGRGGGGVMALSMEEQRILAQIEEQLTRTEPGLAARLATFRGPRLATLVHSPRARFAFSLAALIGV